MQHDKPYDLLLTDLTALRSRIRALTILPMSACGMGSDSGNFKFPLGPAYRAASARNDLLFGGG